MAQTDPHGEPFDLTAETKAICEKLGLEPHNVAELTWRPYELQAVVFRTNERGKKYIEPDTDEPAIEHRTFEIRG